MREPLLLYSTNTWLAYAIAERFYGGVHYAWCSPVYDGAMAAPHVNIPPSSSPAEIYRLLLEETRRGERHSEFMARKLEGVLKGARAKLESGVIGSAQKEEIREMVQELHPREFRPVLFIIPYHQVRGIVKEVPIHERAHPFSEEYRIEALPRNSFHMIELRT
jgi:hypothetical protein